MESDSSTVLIAFLVGLAVMVLVVPPLLLAAYRWMRHGHGHRSHRSSHRSDREGGRGPLDGPPGRR